MEAFEQFQVSKNRTIWNKQFGQFQDGHVEVSVDERLYKEIQLKALKEGMRRAAKIPHRIGVFAPLETCDAILAAAEQLTEKDLYL